MARLVRQAKRKTKTQVNTAPFYMPDTNVFSAYARGGDTALVAKMDVLQNDILLSAIALAEMEYGWRKAGQSTHRIRRQQGFAARIRPLAFDESCAVQYGRLKNFLLHARPVTHGNANPIGERDMLIAAHALALNAVLVTHNTREFSTVPGLVVEDWQSGP